MRNLLFVLCASMIGCGGPALCGETEEPEETPSVLCDVTHDLNKDGCMDAVCRTLLLEGSELNGRPLAEALVIETRYFGSCENPQDLVLDPECSTDLDVTEGDGCGEVVCQLPSGDAIYKCE